MTLRARVHGVLENPGPDHRTGQVFSVFRGVLILLNILAVISIPGIGLVALPTGILGSRFIAELSKRKAGPLPGAFRHKKNGPLFHGIQRARDGTNARDGTPVVVYAPVENPSGPTFVRDQAEFEVKFVRVEGDPGPLARGQGRPSEGVKPASGGR